MSEIKGYRKLNEEEKAVINAFKGLEIDLLESVNRLKDQVYTTPRWYHIAVTHFEQGFMALVRSVAKPEDPIS